jgi:hypothetical protein
MKNTEVSDVRKHCPVCGHRSSSVVDCTFIEYGEWDGSAYEFEGDVYVYRCADRTCRFAFADVTGIPSDPPAPYQRAGTTPESATENHDKSLE